MIKLSSIPKGLTANEAIDIVIDRGSYGVVNDVSGNGVEYALDDILEVWDKLNGLI